MSSKSDSHRWFYSVASLVLLVLTFVGFKMFYLSGQAFPGRPLTPPIRHWLMLHGVLMTLWMLLAVVQPMLVGLGRRRLHMIMGLFGTALAVAIVIVGYQTAIQATRVNPPEMKLFGLVPKAFLTVPLLGVVSFGAFVWAGIMNRRRPEIHRPMMFMASMSVIAAAMGRMPVLNDWYAGTALEHWFSAFLTTILLGVVFLGIKCLVERRWDRWFAGALGMLTVFCVAASWVARTEGWMKVATWLVGGTSA